MAHRNGCHTAVELAVAGLCFFVALFVIAPIVHLVFDEALSPDAAVDAALEEARAVATTLDQLHHFGRNRGGSNAEEPSSPSPSPLLRCFGDGDGAAVGVLVQRLTPSRGTMGKQGGSGNVFSGLITLRELKATFGNATLPSDECVRCRYHRVLVATLPTTLRRDASPSGPPTCHDVALAMADTLVRSRNRHVSRIYARHLSPLAATKLAWYGLRDAWVHGLGTIAALPAVLRHRPPTSHAAVEATATSTAVVVAAHAARLSASTTAACAAQSPHHGCPALAALAFRKGATVLARNDAPLLLSGGGGGGGGDVLAFAHAVLSEIAASATSSNSGYDEAVRAPGFCDASCAVVE